MVAAIGRRLPLQEVSYSAGLSFLVHGLVALTVLYAPQWLRGKPFKVPVNYEVILVAPSGSGGTPKAAAAKAAPPQAKAAASKGAVAQPRDLLMLPSTPRSAAPPASMRALPPPPAARTAAGPPPAPARSDEMALPSKRAMRERQAPATLAPPPAVPTMASAKPAPQVAPIVPPAVAPPPSLAVVRPSSARSVPPVVPAPVVPTPTVIAPQVAPPPVISQPVITPPVVTVPKVDVSASRVARVESKTVKPSPVTAPTAVSAPALDAQSQADRTPGLGVGGRDMGATVGNTDPALAYYIVLIQEKIDSNWIPPKRAPGTVDSVVLYVRVLRSGQVRDLSINASSGDRVFDAAALRAVRLSSPLPPLPPLYKAETILLELRFDFEGVKI